MLMCGQIKTLHSELCQSEVRREEAEKRATHAAENMMRLTDVAGQMEETRQENESLNKQVYVICMGFIMHGN